MAVQLDTIRAMAERVAAQHHLEVVDVEYQGSGKFRVLRIFIEKDAAERAKLAAEMQASKAQGSARVVRPELLSGVTHEDCSLFAHDFGALLDAEDPIPGNEYTLEVSSPGLERKLTKIEDFVRFQGSLLKVQTFTPVRENRQWRGRLLSFADGLMQLDPSALKKKGKAKKVDDAAPVEISLSNVEKASLLAEI